jgi:L-lysine 6-transaminase
MNNNELQTSNYTPKYFVGADEVHDELKKYMLVDGFDFVLDLKRSRGAYFLEARTGKKFTDFFSCFASMPIGMNHPKMSDDNFIRYIGEIALNKPSNSDIYTEAMASFVKTFFNVAVRDLFKYSFFIAGGALAVENALKAAFDWKVRKNFQKGYTEELGHKIMHFKQAFHGRSGYTMSLTNTDERKIKYYPKFNDWPRILNPKMTFPQDKENLESVIMLEEEAIAQMKAAFLKYKDDIAAIIIEPIQGEGGDNHFRPEFMKALRHLADENDALLIFDEVQTGLGLTGTYWTFEQLGVVPDIMVFGKKMQVCGILSTTRIDEVQDNVFHHSSRINSTWGGNLVDMVRSTRYLEIMDEENMLDNVRTMGSYLDSKMTGLATEFPETISNVRGRGLFHAFDVRSGELRSKIIDRCFHHGLIILGCGDHSIRFRPPLNISANLIDEGIGMMETAIKECLA